MTERPTNWQKDVQRIYDQNFLGAKQKKITDWLYKSIIKWMSTGKIASFYPFSDFFPSNKTEENSLADIVSAFPQESQAELFFKQAIVDVLNLLGNNIVSSREGENLTPLDTIVGFRFVLQMAKIMRLQTVVPTLTVLIQHETFHTAGEQQGYSLPRDVLETVIMLEQSDENVARFWHQLRLHIDKSPGLSIILVSQLVRINPGQGKEIASDNNIVHAMKKFDEQLKAAGERPVKSLLNSVCSHIDTDTDEGLALSHAYSSLIEKL